VISSVAFRNFKALRHTTLRLAPFNLVIGANGSGKTSLIEALLRLRTLSRLPLGDADAPTRAGGPEIVFGFAPPHTGVIACLACTSETVCDLLRVDTPSPAEWSGVRTELGRIRSFLFDHRAMAQPAARDTGGELSPDGGNIAAVLARWQRDRPAAFSRLEAELVRLLPEFTAIACIAQPDGRVALALAMGSAEPAVGAENLSQGVLFLLGILLLSHDPEPPSVVCIEEIDRGIHPRMLRALRDALYRLTYPSAMGETRAPVQVIATTHSPYLLDLFRDHPEEVVITQKHGRESRFERLADRADLPELMKEGSLGDMWYSGILGGVPEEP